MIPRKIPDFLAARLEELPKTSGVYIFKNTKGQAIYIGKALSIRKRIAGHFRFFHEASSKEGVMLKQIARIDYLETPTEAEALLLESSLVKESLPKYNQLLRDDKSYPYLKITADEYPRLMVVRSRKSDGGKYFGPYTSATLLRQAVKMLRSEFPMRTCRKFPKKVCLLYHIGQCGGPCEAKQSFLDYQKTVKELEAFLLGRRDALVRSLTKRMKEHSSKKEYEKAQGFYQAVRALSSVPVASGKKEGGEVLEDLRKALGLPRVPNRMECFDISNIQGKEAVGSMVVFVDGKPSRSDYRRFKIRTVSGIDDYQMMREVVRRRYTRLTNENEVFPDLVVIDGGKGHLAVVKEELDRMNLSTLPMISIAKQHEHIFLPGDSRPHIFSPSSPCLHLIRHLRDEAHRFAIRYHRHLHRKESLR